MNELQRTEWREAYEHANHLTGRRELDTAVLAIGIMLQSTIEVGLSTWLNTMTLKVKRGR